MRMCGSADVDTGKMRISVRIKIRTHFTRWFKIFRHNLFSKSQHTALLLLSVAYIRRLNITWMLV